MEPCVVPSALEERHLVGRMRVFLQSPEASMLDDVGRIEPPRLEVFGGGGGYSRSIAAMSTASWRRRSAPAMPRTARYARAVAPAGAPTSGRYPVGKR
jgi:hypothetical protein